MFSLSLHFVFNISNWFCLVTFQIQHTHVTFFMLFSLFVFFFFSFFRFGRFVNICCSDLLNRSQPQFANWKVNNKRVKKTKSSTKMFSELRKMYLVYLCAVLTCLWRQFDVIAEHLRLIFWRSRNRVSLTLSLSLSSWLGCRRVLSLLLFIWFRIHQAESQKTFYSARS